MRAARALRRRLIAAVVVLLATASTTRARADEPQSPRDYDAPDPDRGLVNYLRAAASVGVVNYLIWQYDWIVDKESIYRVTSRDVFKNPLAGFPYDEDTLTANFFGHPYSGAMFFGAARSAGLSFWESAPYAAGGSVMWELLSESQKPAVNDIMATTLGGITLGEIFYRCSSLALNDSRTGFARFTREAASAFILPTRALDRVETGKAWTLGAPPIPKPGRLQLHGGANSVLAGSVTNDTRFHPSAVVAVDAEYGDLLPAEGKTTIPAYDFFDFYGGAVLSSQETEGFVLSELGLLHGWSTDLSSDEGPARDNNVIGFAQSGDYNGTNSVEFSAFGLGAADFFVHRTATGRRLRIGFEAEYVPVAAVVSSITPFVATTSVRNYNFSMGLSFGLNLRWDLGALGQLGFMWREYGTEVVNGIIGNEIFGYARGWYEVDAIRNLVGVGFAPNFMHFSGTYSGAHTDTQTQLSLEVYATLRL